MLGFPTLDIGVRLFGGAQHFFIRLNHKKNNPRLRIIIELFVFGGLLYTKFLWISHIALKFEMFPCGSVSFVCCVQICCI